MIDNQMTAQGETHCEMRWVTVQDAQGAQHLESRWIDPGVASNAATVHAA